MERRELLQGINIRSVVRQIGIHVSGEDGVWLSCRCPLPSHGGEDKNPSFRICVEENGDHEKGFWICHKEGKSGSIFDLVIETGNANDFKQACQYLNVAVGNNRSTPEAQKDRKSKGKATSVVSHEVLETQQNALFRNERAMSYLRTTRGLLDRVITDSGLGFSGHKFDAITVPYRADDRVARNCKMIAWPKPAKGDSWPRAMFTEKGGWQGLYVPFDLTTDSPVIVVESELDCLLLWSIGRQAIATGGTANMKHRTLSSLEKAGLSLVIYADSDEAGRKVSDAYRIEVFKEIDQTGASPKISILTPKHDAKGKDIGDQFVWFLAGEAQGDPAQAREMTATWLDDRFEDSLDVDDHVTLDQIMDLTKEGEPKKTQRNLRLILNHHRRFAGKLWVDSMGERLMWEDRPFRDTDISRSQEWIESETGLLFSTDHLYRKMTEVAESRRRHPVQDYLERCRWDGKPRIGQMVGTVLQVDEATERDIELKRAYLKRWMISAVARAMRPGCKADAMLVLVGGQGLGKSTFGRSLVTDRWFSDQEAHIENKDYLAEIHRNWIVEVSELDATTRRKDIAQLRGFVSRQTDTFRPPYGRTSIDLDRSFVFLGTTNHQSIVREEDGRRYWPVKVSRIDTAWVEASRDHLWGEALALFRQGEPWWLTDAENALRAKDTEDTFSEVDPALEVVQDFLEDYNSPSEFTVKDILKELNDNGLQRASNQIGTLLRRLGCKRVMLKERGRQRRVWIRGDTAVTG